MSSHRTGPVTRIREPADCSGRREQILYFPTPSQVSRRCGQMRYVITAPRTDQRALERSTNATSGSSGAGEDGDPQPVREQPALDEPPPQKQNAVQQRLDQMESPIPPPREASASKPQ